MLDYWTPYVFCYSDSIAGSLLVAAILFFYQKIWWIISGITWMSGEMYLTFLLLYGYNEEIFLHYTFSQILQQDRPLCTFTVEPIGDRELAMPSLEAQLTFSIASFLVLHMFLMQQLSRFRATLVIITFPIFTLFALYITRNNTAAQLACGAVFGALNGARRILIYHFFLKRQLALLAHYKPFNWIIPLTPLTVTRYEDSDDQTTTMLRGKVKFADADDESVEEPETISEILLHDLSSALLGQPRQRPTPTEKSDQFHANAY